MTGKTASAEIKDILGVLMFDCAKMQGFMKEHNLEMTEIWFSEFERYVSMLKKTMEECDRRIYYGEEWDQ